MTRRLCLAVSVLALGCGSDTGSDPGPDAAIDLTPVSATPGQRCAPHDRIGLVEITGDGRARAFLFDRADPRLEEPALSDAACDFYEYRPRATCDGCGDGEICDLDGRCVTAPRRATDGRLVLRAGGREQVLQADPELGTLGGAITLAGSSFTAEVFGFGQRVDLETELAVPGPLAGFSASLAGTYDAPESVEASWEPGGDDSSVFTHIPINHHAAAPTFTECAIPASAGALSVSQPMLEPLAVSTGLEFQTFEHVRFAAAETSRGCVELRFAHTQSLGL